MKKKSPFLLIFILSFSLIFAQNQNKYPVVFQIVDSQSGKPLEGAEVYIQQLGHGKKTSNGEGKVYYESVPAGKIDFTIILDRYEVSNGSINISEETKSNTPKIELTRKLDKDKVLITGQVVDKKGRGVEGLKVDVRSGNIKYETQTEKGGYFSTEFDLKRLKQYNVKEFFISVGSDKCSIQDKIPIPQNNYVFRPLSLDCRLNKTHRLLKGKYIAGGVGIIVSGILELMSESCYSKYQDSNGVDIDKYDCSNTYRRLAIITACVSLTELTIVIFTDKTNKKPPKNNIGQSQFSIQPSLGLDHYSQPEFSSKLTAGVKIKF